MSRGEYELGLPPALLFAAVVARGSAAVSVVRLSTSASVMRAAGGQATRAAVVVLRLPRPWPLRPLGRMQLQRAVRVDHRRFAGAVEAMENDHALVALQA